MSKVFILETVCEAELWAGFFGIDETGSQPECNTTITEEVDEDCIDVDDEGVRPSYTVSCPKCGCSLEWPQTWTILSTANN